MRFRSHPVVSLSLLLLPLAALGCGSSNRLEIRLSGTDDAGKPADETISFIGSGASGSRDGMFTPSIEEDGVTQHLVAYFSTPQQETFYGDEPVATLFLTERVVDRTAEPAQTLVDRRAHFGLGPISGQLTIDFRNVRTVPVREFDVERWHFTGNATHPLEFRGRSLPPRAGDEGPLKADVTFEFRADCSSDIRKSGGLCGGFMHPSWAGTEVAREVESITGAPHCPAEVVRAFAGEGVGAMFRWMPGESMQVDGGARLGCVVTHEGENHLCGAEVAGVGADGCTWDVSALGSVDSASGGGERLRRMWMTISARAREGCTRAVTYCNSDVRAYDR